MDENPPLTEPLIIPDVFATGVDVERVNGVVRLISWATHGDEHRIVNRLVLPDAVARAMIRDLRKVLVSGGH